MDVRELVTGHYGNAGLADRILTALGDHGVDLEVLTATDLAPLDQLHAGGAEATAYVLKRIAPGPSTRLLDVGCGIGGASRMAADAGAGSVTGADLTPEFVEAARRLTEQVGLADRAEFVTTPGEELPFDDGAFDAAMMIHVGMNIPDKEAVFEQVRRVLVPGSTFVLYEQMRCGDGELPYPMPWAVDERSSFVESPHQYAHQLTTAGFEVVDTVNRSREVTGGPRPGGLDATVLFGPEFARRIENNVAATKAGDLGAIVMVARAI